MIDVAKKRVPSMRLVLRLMDDADLDYFAAAVKACERVAKDRDRKLVMLNGVFGFEFFEREVDE